MNFLINDFKKEQHRDIPELDDEVLFSRYCDAPSVKKRIHEIKTLLREHGLSHTQCACLAKKLLVVPPGTKSHIRGCMFNDIVKREIRKVLGSKSAVCAEFEKHHACFSEIPDWILTKGNKILVGFNQISLFGGGHQLNRASKYVMDDVLHRKLSKRRIKMVCVVKDLPINATGKSRNILLKGIEKKRIYCVGGLKKLIRDYFC